MKRGESLAFAVVAIATIVGIAVIWKYGVLYEGPTPTHTVVVEILDVDPSPTEET